MDIRSLQTKIPHNNTNWEPYSISMDHEHLVELHNHQIITPFAHNNHIQWPNYPQVEPSHSSQTQLQNHHNQAENLKISSAEQQEEEEGEEDQEEDEALGAMKEMMFKIAAMQPVDIDPATVRKPKRRNVRISDDPQSVAARHRRERISEKIRILQRLVPGGTKMDTASMLDEAIRYVKFLKRQIRVLQSNNAYPPPLSTAPPTTTSDDWVGVSAGTSYMFGGNNINNVINDAANHHEDDILCFNNHNFN